VVGHNLSRGARVGYKLEVRHIAGVVGIVGEELHILQGLKAVLHAAEGDIRSAEDIVVEDNYLAEGIAAGEHCMVAVEDIRPEVDIVVEERRMVVAAEEDIVDREVVLRSRQHKLVSLQYCELTPLWRSSITWIPALRR